MEGHARNAQHPATREATHADPMRCTAHEHSVAYHIGAGAACALVYAVVAIVVGGIPFLSDYAIFRPSYAIGPIAGLFFGWPAIIGCALANAVVNAATGSAVAGWFFAAHTAIQVLYNALPYLLWYVIYRKSPNPYPRIDSSSKATCAMALFILTAAIFETATFFTEGAYIGFLAEADLTPGYVAGYGIRCLGDIIVLVFFGLPLLIALERSRLSPTAPRRIRALYQHRPRISLTQLAVVTLLFSLLAVMVLSIVVAYADDFLGHEVTSEYVVEMVMSIYLSMAACSAISFPLVLAIIRYVERHLTRPVEMLTTASSDFVTQLRAYQEEQTSDHELFKHATASLVGDQPKDKHVKLSGEIADLVNSTNTMRESIVTYLGELETITAERERVAAELDIASRIQLSAVPHTFTTLEKRYHLDIAGMLKPAREVGGDFYDAFDIKDGRVGFIIADVSGKGVPAALFMMRALAEIREEMRFCDDVGDALTRANETLCAHNDAMLFVTVFACVLDTRSGQLTFANAGHNPPWFAHALSLDAHAQGFIEARPGLVIGVMDHMRYKSRSMTLLPKDRLLFYTDGITEAMNEREELFGTNRLDAALQEAYQDAQCPMESAVERVYHAIEAFAGDAPQADDITMLGVCWDAPLETCEIAPHDTELEKLFAFVEDLCQKANAPARVIFDLKLVLEELFVNIAHYGFPEGTPEKPVIVQAAVLQDEKVLHLAMSDAGVAYNPLTHESQLVVGELGAQNKVGGLGIHLVRQSTDHLSYERVGNRNIIQLVKNLE